jgi:Sulfotransferase family
MVTKNNYVPRMTITRADISPDQRLWLDRYRTWRRFHHGVRKRGRPLLMSLPRYSRCVLVAGCQRSGTTMLTRLIASAPEFSRLRLTVDDELDAALALAGLIDLPNDRRFCFQTTYLNESFHEYSRLEPDQRLIWVIRNPYSVVYSMLYNWKRFALNELYEGCGAPSANSPRLRRAKSMWPFGPSRLEKACLAYRGKVAQIVSIRRLLPPEQLLTVDYDLVSAAPNEWLPRIFQFVGASYDPVYAQEVRGGLSTKADALSFRARSIVERLALPTYRECIEFAAGDGAARAG